MFTLTGAHIRLYINGVPYNSAQTVNYSLSYGEKAIYGIDSPYPQEIGTTQAQVRGAVSGIRIKYSGGIQALNARPQFKDILSSPYVSIRINDRQSGEDLIFIPQAKITDQEVSIRAKGIVSLSFSFMGLIGLEPLDRVAQGGLNTLPSGNFSF